MLLLGTGHCFRDHVLEVCPEFARFSSDAEGIRKSFEGSSLETIKHMVAAGMGVTLVPRLSVPKEALQTRPIAAQGRPGVREIHSVRRRSADAPRGAGLAPQLHPLRGHRRPAQFDLRLRTAGREAPVVKPAIAQLWPLADAMPGQSARLNMAKMTVPAQPGILEPVPRVTDAMFRISKPVTGAYFWCPPIVDGRLDLRQLGL